MSEKITLTLDRLTNNLLVEFGVNQIIGLWDVTGLEWAEESLLNHVRILRDGRQIAGAWDVAEIKEKW